jgi:hypothetical protein
MTAEAFAYVAGAAGAEETMRANRRAFERIAIVPRMLRDVSTRDPLGRAVRAVALGSSLLAPVGVHHGQRCGGSDADCRSLADGRLICERWQGGPVRAGSLLK